MAKSTMNYTYESPQTVTWLDETSGDSKVFDFTQLSDEIQAKVFAYGAQHLLRDRTSAIKDGAEKLAVSQKLFDRLLSGEWKAVRQSSGGSAKSSMIVEAISRLKGIELPEARDLVDGLPEANLKALRQNPQVKMELAKIKIERLNAAAEKADDGDDGGSIDDIIG